MNNGSFTVVGPTGIRSDPVPYNAPMEQIAKAFRQAAGDEAPQAGPRPETERDRFYAQEHDCGHGLIVRFGKGDWYHVSDGSICTQEPEAPPIR